MAFFFFFIHLYSYHLAVVGLMIVPDHRTESLRIKFIHKAVITFLSNLSKVIIVLRQLN